MDLHTRRRVQRVLDVLVDHKLARHETRGHDYESTKSATDPASSSSELTHPRPETCKQPTESRLPPERDQSLHHGTLGPMTLVNLRKEGIRGLKRRGEWMSSVRGPART